MYCNWECFKDDLIDVSGNLGNNFFKRAEQKFRLTSDMLNLVVSMLTRITWKDDGR